MNSYTFLLHANDFSERGDSVTLLSVANLLSLEFGAKVIIAIPQSASTVSRVRLEEAKTLGLPVFRYTNKAELDAIAIKNTVTHSYFFSGGRREDLPFFDPLDPQSFRVANTFHITHVVFRNFDPHGDVYAYVSEWLYSKARLQILIRKAFNSKAKNKTDGTLVCSWPHFVNLAPRGDSIDSVLFKGELPSDARIIGRIGGFNEFSDPAAKKAVKKILEFDAKAFFIFVNTRKFIDHPRVLYTRPLSRTEVTAFYDICDLFINGRRMGESFGYSIFEPLSVGKPVIAPNWLRNPIMDGNHLRILGPLGLLYSTSNSLLRIYKRLLEKPLSEDILKASSQNYTQGVASKLLKEILTWMESDEKSKPLIRSRNQVRVNVKKGKITP